jgi:LynF/TruF/PatF family peptide O-prenyltransferase
LLTFKKAPSKSKDYNLFKIELDKLIASRFMLFFQDKAQEWPKYLAQSLAFFQQVENRVGVQLDYSLLQQFLGDNFDF